MPPARPHARKDEGAAGTIAGLVLITFFAASATATAQQRTTAILDLFVNGVQKGEALVLLEDEGDAWVGVSRLAEAGVKQVTGRRLRGRQGDMVSLRSMAPELTFTVSEEELVLRLEVSSRLFGTTVREFGAHRPRDLEYGRSNSAFLNYAWNWRSIGGSQLTAEAGWNIGGVLVGTTVSHVPGRTPLRGPTSVTLDDRRRLTRFVIGDSFATAGSLGGSALLGGVSVSRNYEVDPYFIRYPTLSFAGALDTPSTIEVIVNDRLVRREDLPAGEFELTKLPIVSGQGDARLVIRDAFGRESEIVSPYYQTRSVLAPGLHEFHYSAGYPRLRSGTDNWNYDRPVFLGTHRFGLTDSFTAGFRGEARAGLVSGGPTMSTRLWRAGELELAAAASRHRASSGAALFAGYSFTGARGSFGASVRSFSSGYATISLDSERSRPGVEANLFAGLRLGSSGSLTARHSIFTSRHPAASGVSSRRERTSIQSSSRLGRRLSLLVSAAKVRDENGSSLEASAGLNVSIGPRTTGYAGYERRGTHEAFVTDVQRALPVGPGYGYRVHVGDAADGRTSAAFLQQNRFGRIEAEQYLADGQHATSVRIAGGLVAIGGGVHATLPVHQSFALVQVPGVAGVRTFLSNHEVGRTGADGNILVPNLLPYYGNQLRIADEDVPVNYNLRRVKAAIAPPYRGGVVVPFVAERVQSITGLLVIQSGSQSIVPSHGQLTVAVNDVEHESPVGSGGEFYLENVPPGRHAALLEHGGGSCRFTFVVPASSQMVVKLGTVVCDVQDSVRR